MEGLVTERGTLDTGDYAVKISGRLAPIVVERKSIADLFGSYSGDAYRREKEKIERARVLGYRFILAVEGSCSEVRKGHRYFRAGEWHQVEKDGLSQIRQIETVSMRYGIEIRYCSGREDMAFMVQELLMTYVRAAAGEKKVEQ